MQSGDVGEGCMDTPKRKEGLMGAMYNHIDPRRAQDKRNGKTEKKNDGRRVEDGGGRETMSMDEGSTGYNGGRTKRPKREERSLAS
jgi:hypothetical protein